jgi:1-phosphofructokinase
MKPSIITVTLNPALDKTLILPHLHIGALNRVQHVRLDPGGKGINVARVLKNFDVDCKATGLIAGTQGRQLLIRLEEEEMQVDFYEVHGETRTNLKIVDEQMKITTEINELGFDIRLTDLNDFQKKLSTLVHSNSMVVLGGSLPLGAPDHIYRDYIEMVNEIGAKVILDADGPALEEGIKAKPFAIKPNIYELEQLVGHSFESEEAIVSAGKHLVESGISIVLISMGAQGSIVLNENEAYRVKPFPIKPESTVGAGDSMVAALVYSLLTNKSLEETAVWTTTAGTITASKPGTQVCTLSEVKGHVSQVHALRI